MNNQQPPEWLSRTAILLGDAAMARLAAARVAVIGMGAVGGYVAEGLARSGVGWLRLVDFDTIKPSNINRQLFALHSTVGRFKVDVAAERLRDINPSLCVEPVREFAHADTLERLLGDGVEVVVDAVDSLNPKVEVILAGMRAGMPVYSALGAATRLDGGGVCFGELFRAKGCPLGRLVRKRLRRRGVEGGDLWCVYSEEERNREAVREPTPEESGAEDEYKRGRERRALGSVATITGMFGLRLAHEVVLRLVHAMKDKENTQDLGT